MYCKKVKNLQAVCLFSGKALCWISAKGGQCGGYYNMRDKEEDVKREGRKEGLMSYHAKQFHGGTTLFIQVDNGNLILMHNGNVSVFDTPYRNKYGDLANKKSEYWNSFKLD